MNKLLSKWYKFLENLKLNKKIFNIKTLCLAVVLAMLSVLVFTVILPNIAKYYASQGDDLYKKGNKEGAIKDYSKAIELNPKFVDAYWCRGVVRHELGDKEGAVKDYSQVIELNPKFIDADVSCLLVIA